MAVFVSSKRDFRSDGDQLENKNDFIEGKPKTSKKASSSLRGFT